MRFKIVTVGWNCVEYIERTLRSIEFQTVADYDVMVVDDATADPRQAELIRSWCDARDDRWNFVINTERRNAVRNQHDAIRALDPADDDVIVWLDLDGDQFAHRRVLERVAAAYDDGQTLLTYGSYRPVPDMGTSTGVTPFPADVVAANAYRAETLAGTCHFNHLRTMKGVIFRHIPPAHFRWPGTDRWYAAGTDYIFMIAGLELAGGRYECIDEVLCLYNHANPYADNLAHPDESAACTQNYLRREPLAPLTPPSGGMPASRRPAGWTELYLPAEVRREILRDVGREWGLTVFIETGTNDGGTPLFLKDDFAELHTIELGQRQWAAAQEMFRPYPHVHCWHGDSTDVLPKVLETIDAPALVWLDGHWSGGDTARGSVDTPVAAELKTLFADGRPHVILVDDARIFKGGQAWEEQFGDYPSIDWVRQLAEVHGYRFALLDDIMRLIPA